MRILFLIMLVITVSCTKKMPGDKGDIKPKEPVKGKIAFGEIRYEGKSEEKWFGEFVQNELSDHLHRVFGDQILEEKDYETAHKKAVAAGPKKTPEELGLDAAKNLKADYLLSGKIQNQDQLKIDIKIYKTSDSQAVLNIAFEGTKEQFYDLFPFIPEKISPELSLNQELKKLIDVFSTKQYGAIEPYAKANFIEKDADKKIALLTQSLAADPEYQPALRELAFTYSEKGDPKKAIETYQKCKDKMEKNQLQNTAAYARTLGNLVEYLSKTNDRKAYMAAFKQYLEAGEKTGIGISQGLFDFGVFLHMKEGKSCEGLVYLEKLAKQPDVKDFELNDFSNLLADVRELCRK